MALVNFVLLLWTALIVAANGSQYTQPVTSKECCTHYGYAFFSNSGLLRGAFNCTDSDKVWPDDASDSLIDACLVDDDVKALQKMGHLYRLMTLTTYKECKTTTNCDNDIILKICVHKSCKEDCVPTDNPSISPTPLPLDNDNTSNPTMFPTFTPTSEPSVTPSAIPSNFPTLGPSDSNAPSMGPVPILPGPTRSPSSVPSDAPTPDPTTSPTSTPSSAPSASPTSSPSDTPSDAPTMRPSDEPTFGPTLVPTMEPYNCSVVETTSLLANIETNSVADNRQPSMGLRSLIAIAGANVSSMDPDRPQTPFVGQLVFTLTDATMSLNTEDTWHECDGSSYDPTSSTYSAVYSVLGSRFGTNFPDCSDKVLIHGNSTSDPNFDGIFVGDTGGELDIDFYSLFFQHKHPFSSSFTPSPSGSCNENLAASLHSAGWLESGANSSASFENAQPWLALQFFIVARGFHPFSFNLSSRPSASELIIGELVILPYDSDAPNEALLPCDGRMVSKLDYNDLYEVLGDWYTWIWERERSETLSEEFFILPDCSERALVGYESDTTYAHIGEGYGSMHTIYNISHFPPHNHSILSNFKLDEKCVGSFEIGTFYANVSGEQLHACAGDISNEMPSISVEIVYYNGSNIDSSAGRFLGQIFMFLFDIRASPVMEGLFIKADGTVTDDLNFDYWLESVSDNFYDADQNILHLPDLTQHLMYHTSIKSKIGQSIGTISFPCHEYMVPHTHNIEIFCNQPSAPPTIQPTQFPSDAPSNAPSPVPTTAPSQVPSRSPSKTPSDAPSNAPSNAPSVSPTSSPTDVPSQTPSDAPARSPSLHPSFAPTFAPTLVPTQTPSNAPSNAPFDAPSISPSNAPTSAPSSDPTLVPTDAPSAVPSFTPTFGPTADPSDAPSGAPSSGPSSDPTNLPTFQPTLEPSNVPSDVPSDVPTNEPSSEPTSEPSDVPSSAPIAQPSDAPSDAPTLNPSDAPTSVPTLEPSDAPSNAPTNVPSGSPSVGPTTSPSRAPSMAPSMGPSVVPSDSPTVSPTSGLQLEPNTTPLLPGDPTQGTTSGPTAEPSDVPTFEPSNAANNATNATNTTDAPTSRPTIFLQPEPNTTPALPGDPTRATTLDPTETVSEAPSNAPTSAPSVFPSDFPTDFPTFVPFVANTTLAPTRGDQTEPNTTPILPRFPTRAPTYAREINTTPVLPVFPTASPTNATSGPSVKPSKMPTVAPSGVPTFGPSVEPTAAPSEAPSEAPSVRDDVSVQPTCVAVDGVWSEFCEWSECVATQTAGYDTVWVQYRTRDCLNGKCGGRDCEGSFIELRECNKSKCDAQWSGWTEWSPCVINDERCLRDASSLCDGFQYRTRTCYTEQSLVCSEFDECECEGSHQQIRPCQTQSCLEIIMKNNDVRHSSHHKEYHSEHSMCAWKLMRNHENIAHGYDYGSSCIIVEPNECYELHVYDGNGTSLEWNYQGKQLGSYYFQDFDLYHVATNWLEALYRSQSGYKEHSYHVPMNSNENIAALKHKSFDVCIPSFTNEFNSHSCLKIEFLKDGEVVMPQDHTWEVYDENKNMKIESYPGLNTNCIRSVLNDNECYSFVLTKSSDTGVSGDVNPWCCDDKSKGALKLYRDNCLLFEWEPRGSETFTQMTFDFCYHNHSYVSTHSYGY